MYWHLTCSNCYRSLWHNSELKETEFCRFCGSWELTRKNFRVQIFRFHTFSDYLKWSEGWGKFYFEKYWIMDIENYFQYYDTHQIENIFDEYT